jgi:hypothetical protein
VNRRECEEAVVKAKKAAFLKSNPLFLTQAAAPVTDAKEGLARLEKLHADCGALLLHSPELQAALGELEEAVFKAKSEKAKVDIFRANIEGGGIVCAFVSCSGEKNGFGEHGVIYTIATWGGARPYANPHEKKVVIVTWSSKDRGSEASFVDHLGRGEQSCTQGRPGSWMQVDLQDYRVFNPTHYCLRHGYSSGGSRLKSFELSGSHDGVTWFKLDVQQHRDSPLPGSGYSTAAFPIGGAAGQGAGYLPVLPVDADRGTQ